MRIFSSARAALVAALTIFVPTVALAQDTIGNRLQAIVTDTWNPLFLLVAVGSGLGGLWMFARGLMKVAVLSERMGGANDHGIMPAVSFMAVGAALVALPDAAGMGMMSILGSARGGSTLGSSGLDFSDTGTSGSWLTGITGGTVGVGGVENCLADTVAPAACMAKNIATNVIPMAVMALFAAVFIAGLIIFATSLIAIARGQESNGRHGQSGVITKMVAAVLLMNAPVAFNLSTQTLLGREGTINSIGNVSDSDLLRYTTGSSLEIVKKYTELIGHAFTILVFFGAWSFVRGIFMIKGMVEGKQQGSFGMAGVYIVAGVLMANAKVSTCFILNTVGGASMAAGFCG
jgi:hypothetical protein